MKKKLFILVTLFLFISCSSLRNTTLNDKKIYLSQEEVEKRLELEKFLKNLKFNLKKNNFIEIEKNFNDSFINRKILSKIKIIDFSQIQILNTKPKFNNDEASNVVAFIFIEEVRYFKFTYRYQNGIWKIIKIKDGR